MPKGPKPKQTVARPNLKKHVTQQSVDAAIWSICDIMRRGNVASALQYVPELTWILFLRILDETEDREEQEADAVGASYASSLKKPYRWKGLGRAARISEGETEQAQRARRCRKQGLHELRERRSDSLSQEAEGQAERDAAPESDL